MNSQEVLQAFREVKPVRFGDLVFDRIGSVTYRDVLYNQYVVDADCEGGTRRLSSLKILQAECIDAAGRKYVLNPLRLEAAKASEVNVFSEADHILEDRLKLIEVFIEWCGEHSMTADVRSLIMFLFSEDLIDAAKAYQIVRAYEREKGESV